MKKIIGVIGFSVVVMHMALVLLGSSVYAAKPTSPRLAISPSPIATPTPTIIEYMLPFPGILPIHPLYIFKNLRDRIIELLITDPISKSEFYILQADKKLNMGVSLAAMGKTTDARQAYAEALVSRTQAITLLEGFAQSGGSVPGHLVEKFTLSLVKHKEVLSASGEVTSGIEAIAARVQKLSGVEVK